MIDASPLETLPMLDAEKRESGFDSRGERNCFSDPARIPLEALRQFPKAVVYMQASNLLLHLIRELRPPHGAASRFFAVQSRYAEQNTVWT